MLTLTGLTPAEIERASEMTDRMRGGVTPQIVDRSIVRWRGRSVANSPLDFPEWTEVYLGTARATFTVTDGLDLEMERSTHEKGRRVFSGFYALPASKRTQLAFQDLMREQNWISDVRSRHHWISYGNVYERSLARETEKWQPLFEHWRTEWAAGRFNSSRKKAETGLEATLLTVGLVGLDLPAHIADNPRKMNEISHTLLNMNEQLKALTGLDGGVLGLNGRVFFKWGHAGQVGYFFERKDGYYEIYIDADRFGHEWMHAYLMWSGPEGPGGAGRSSNVLFKERSEAGGGVVDLLKGLNATHRYGRRGLSERIRAEAKGLFTPNQAAVDCWRCATSQAAKQLRGRAVGLEERRAALAAANSVQAGGQESTAYILNRGEMVAEAFRDTLALRVGDAPMGGGNNGSVLFNLSADEASAAQPVFRRFFAVSGGRQWRVESSEYAARVERGTKLTGDGHGL